MVRFYVKTEYILQDFAENINPLPYEQIQIMYYSRDTSLQFNHGIKKGTFVERYSFFSRKVIQVMKSF